MEFVKSTAIEENVVTFIHSLEDDVSDLPHTLNELKESIFNFIRVQLEVFLALKWYVAVKVKFTKMVNNEEITNEPTFHGAYRPLLEATNLENKFALAVHKIMESMAKWVRDGSGWQLDKIISVHLRMVKYNPLHASSYIKTPTAIENPKRGITNIKNTDNKCFLWCILAELYPVKRESKRNLVRHYENYENKLNMEGVEYPVRVCDVKIFERNNPTVSVNVFGYENGIELLQRTSHYGRPHHVNLLYIESDEGDNSHYCLITDLEKLLGKGKKNHYFCNYCLRRFSSKPLIEAHSCNPSRLLAIPDSSSFIPTPKELSNNYKGIINIRNDDQKSFLWSVLVSKFGADNHNNYRVSYLRLFEDEVNMSGIEYPVTLPDVDKFEKLNPEFKINIYGYENREIYPIRVVGQDEEQEDNEPEDQDSKYHINLLMLTKNNGTVHYCFISDMSRFLAHLTKHKAAVFYCLYCLHRFSREDLLQDHLPLCKRHVAQKTRMPTQEKKWMYFTNYTLCHKVLFTVYCDFESYLVPIDSCDNKPDTSHTTNINRHEPSGFCYAIIDSEGKLYKKPVLYTGPNVVDTFLNSLMEDSLQLMKIIKHPEDIVMTPEDELDFQNATECHLCHKSIAADEIKNKNHNHQTGKYLGAAHSGCNMNYQVPEHIPVFFHNLRNYDNHHLMQGFGKFKESKLECIATSSEKFISVTLDSLRFLDSLQFLNASLDTLVTNLAKDGIQKFPILTQWHSESRQVGDINLLVRKGVYPYDYITDESKLRETQLPHPDTFFNKLTDSEIDKDDYLYAENVWRSFQMSTMQDYHDLYLMSDVLLLADVFENFRTTSIKYYEIDPCNSYSAPGLAWSAMLKKTEVRLELLTNSTQHLFIEAGIRGGVAQIPNRYAKANNPLIPGYDATKPTNYIMYLDCNNLYGTAMSEALPHSNFVWLERDEIEALDVRQVSDNNDIGYILEVDLEYPKDLHDSHTDYPLAPETKCVTSDMLSPYNLALQEELQLPTSAKVKKLLTTLDDKEKYILHYRNLKFYLDAGLVLKRTHRVLSFHQSKWLESFIDFNTKKRQDSQNAFEKDFFKLMNNAVYGKSLENVRKWKNLKLVSDKKKLIKLVASPRFQDLYVYNENLVGVSMKKQTVNLNRPIYVGFTVLDISKLIMYQFHYNWAVRKYGKDIKLCMTDTDSLLYDIQTEDVYADIKNDLPLFDTSDYPENHDCFSIANKKKLGKFKDEMNSRPVREFIGLRAKCYSILDFERREKKVAKGVARVAIKNQLKHELYRVCLEDHKLKVTTSVTIRSTNHELFTQKLSKLSLSPYDDKRYILQDGKTTLPYGHYRILQQQHSLKDGRLEGVSGGGGEEEEDEDGPFTSKRSRSK